MDNDRQSLNFINDVRACPAVIYFRFQALPQHHRGDSGGTKTTNLRDEFGEQISQQDAVFFHHFIGNGVTCRYTIEPSSRVTLVTRFSFLSIFMHYTHMLSLVTI